MATKQIKATLAYDDGSTVDVTEFAEWASSDEGVATVDGGLITPVAAGEAEITATISGLTSSACVVTVPEPG